MNEYHIAMLAISGLTLVTTFFATRRSRPKPRQPTAKVKKPNIVAVKNRMYYTLQHCAYCGQQVAREICAKCGYFWCLRLGMEVAFRRQKQVPTPDEVLDYVKAKQR
jgi:hypothetical protein